MRKAIRKTIQIFSETFPVNGPIVEIGSYYTSGSEKLSNLRPFFSNKEYIGCDIRHGINVDRIEDAQQLKFEDGSIGTIFMFEILEHLPSPQKAIIEAHRVLREDGMIAISVPFNYHLHGFPSDYWRFTASGVHQLLSCFPDKMVFAVGPKIKPAFIFAVASKQSSAEFTQQKAVFRKRVQDSFQNSKMQGYFSVLKERGRDLLGHLVGRSHLSVDFFDDSVKGGYVDK